MNTVKGRGKLRDLEIFNFDGMTVRTQMIEGEAWLVGKDVAEVLGYSRTTKAIRDHVDTEDVGEILLRDSMGRMQETPVINESGMYSLVLSSRLPRAKEFKRWVTSEVLPSLRKHGHYETPEYTALLSLQSDVTTLKQDLEASGLLRPFVNPRYAFERLNVRYRIATEDNGHRGIHEAIGNYFGFTVPYSTSLPVTLRDWVIAKVDSEPKAAIGKIQAFIVGIETGQIIRSTMGNWVNLNGYTGNDVEWPKILRNFHGACAYCGGIEKLVPEHIVSQRILAETDPGGVDLIGNVVPACHRCNEGKGTRSFEQWYPLSPVYSNLRHRKILRYMNGYRLNEGETM